MGWLMRENRLLKQPGSCAPRSLHAFERDGPDLEAWHPFIITICGHDGQMAFQSGGGNKQIDIANQTSTASQKFRRGLETGRRPLVGPVKSSVGCAVVVGNKGQDAGAQLLHGEATESGKQATDEDAEPDLNLVEKGNCVWE